MRTSKASLYFDVVSPYTYLNLVTWSRYLPLWPSVDLALRPVFLGGIMKATGNKPPGMLRQKHAFMMQDLRRCSQQANIPLLDVPTNFLSEVARASLQVQRTLCAAEQYGIPKSKRLDLALGFSYAIHADPALRCSENTLTVAPPLFHSAFSRAGFDEAEAKTIIQLVSSAEVKGLLQAATDEAVARGAFGSPTLVIESNAAHESGPSKDNLLIFGSDRMEQIAWILGEAWKGPNPSAVG